MGDGDFVAPKQYAAVSVKSPPKRRWEPQPDITAYELAQALPALLNAVWGAWSGDPIAQLPASVQRHFVEVEE